MSADGDVEQMSNMMVAIDDHLRRILQAWDLATRVGVTDVVLPVGFAQLIIMVTLTAVRRGPQ